MATLTLKNVPDELYAELKKAAERNRRSLNQEAISRLILSAAGPPKNARKIVEELRQFKATLPKRYENPIEEIDRRKREGRE